MVAAVLHDGLWKEPNVIFAKHEGVFKEVSESTLRLIGVNSLSGTGPLTLTPWEPTKEGDLLLLFLAAEAAITIPPGFVHIRTASGGGAYVVSAFFAFADASGSFPIIASGFTGRMVAFVYRGSSGIGVSNNYGSNTTSATQVVSLGGMSAGSLMAAATGLPAELTGVSGANALNLGFGPAGRGRWAATTIGKVPSPPSTGYSLGLVSASASVQDIVAVEILAK
jgi:hypothetical protein